MERARMRVRVASRTSPHVTGMTVLALLHPEVATERCPDFRFVLRGAFPVSQWLARSPCRVVPGHSSGGCARFTLASLLRRSLDSYLAVTGGSRRSRLRA